MPCLLPLWRPSWWLYSFTPAPAPTKERAYDRAKLERLRNGVRRVRAEWMKFPHGLPEVERQNLFKELEAAGDDFTRDARLGKSIREMLSEARLMLTLGSDQYAAAHGIPNQYERLSEHNQKLQQAVLDILEETKTDVIYADGNAPAVGAQMSRKLACEELQLKKIEGEFFIRARVKNGTQHNSEPVKAYLEAITTNVGDPLKEIESIDLPLPLYTQERLRERINARDGGDGHPVRPALFSGDQSKWYEIFQITEPLDRSIHLFLAAGRADIVPLPIMTFKCKVYGWGTPLAFSVTYEEVGDDWQVRLETGDGQIFGPERPVRDDE